LFLHLHRTALFLSRTVVGVLGFAIHTVPLPLIIMVLQNDIDLLNPPAELEKRKHKLKRLVQSPNSFFMDVKCQGCFNITTVFSHSQTVVVCGNCQTVLCQPTGGRAKLTEGCSFRRKGD
uniref:40S ribosomal protein S27 n=1 Tax=Cucumis melo TaxID=3656 RepID=A0A9I9DR86_CUCME